LAAKTRHNGSANADPEQIRQALIHLQVLINLC
jgi:hypothetical protein